jgi:hypothetical protein
MKKYLIWVVTVVIAVGLGVGAAAVVSGLIPAAAARGGILGNSSITGQRISIDEASNLAKQYVSNYGNNLQVSEVMEFSDNFYVVVKESNTGRGAFELLIDPFTGAIYSEPGPNMMWNFKYSPMGGMMGGFQSGDNTLSLDQAVQRAKNYLDANLAGAKISLDGISFYGHYTFDYQINNKTTGMLSVNGVTGDVWLHTWHGSFIQEVEVK